MTYGHSSRRGAPALVRRQRPRRARAAGHLPARALARSSPRGCTATCRCARSAWTSSSGPSTRPTCASTGCIGIDDEAFAAIRDGLPASSSGCFAAILSRPRRRTDVYALWREITADDVAAAGARAASRRALLAPVARHSARPGGARAAPQTVTPAGRARRCARRTARCSHRKRRGARCACWSHSLLEHASRPLHAVGARAPRRQATAERLAERFPELTVSWVPARPGSSPRPAARSRLGGAAARRADAPARAAAAAGGRDRRRRRARRPRPRRPRARGAAPAGHARSSGFGVIHAAAARLRDRTDAAAELRRTAHARHAFDFDAFIDRRAGARPRADAGGRAARAGAPAGRRSSASTDPRCCTSSPGPTARRSPSAGRRCRPACRSAAAGCSTGPTP